MRSDIMSYLTRTIKFYSSSEIRQLADEVEKLKFLFNVMVRVKGGMTTRSKHKKVLHMAKGYRMTRRKQIKKAKEAVLHAGQYAYNGRKLKKRDFRTLWIVRLNAAVSKMGLKYNQFVHKLKEHKVGLDRKILSQIAVGYPKVFEKIIEKVK